MTTTDLPRKRETKQRAAIWSAVAAMNRFVSAQDLHAQLRADGHTVGLATVYRTLQALAAEGQLDIWLSPDGESTYRSCSREHHHHLTCRSCRTTIEINASEIEGWSQQMGANFGFSSIEHIVELSGICTKCRI